VVGATSSEGFSILCELTDRNFLSNAKHISDICHLPVPYFKGNAREIDQHREMTVTFLLMSANKTSTKLTMWKCIYIRI